MKANFSKSADGLVPAIVQDARTDKVLMLGFMSEESLEVTKATGRVTFFSRSRQELWTKGSTSGNFLKVVDIKLDCDADTFLIKANPTGPACHTGSDTCFGEANTEKDFLLKLEDIISERLNSGNEDSYTAKLFASGLNRIAQKVGEEAVEVVIAAKDDDRDAFIGEAADLVFHLLVLAAYKRVSLSDIKEKLRSRHENKKIGEAET
jgi:phosphoribosyl-AMP cyclohydrolase / phosphoribosyl-ATP pyrophosphohydrolase